MAKRNARANTKASRPAPAGRSGRDRPIVLGDALVGAFLTNERINQVLIGLVAPEVWRVFPASSKRRNIATSFAHIHNVRCMRLKMSAKGAAVPGRLDRGEVVPAEAKKALAASARAMTRLIQESLDAGGHVRDYPDVVSLVCAAINHEAHHRGQICHWARELGHPLTPEQQLLLWDWHRHWKEASSTPW